ncbi:uncharacterized protein VTP21DRAFT_9826 [Calcarisporiella thermophila]|uniref:uncharacterized protein n=1 Tax=Calcarisporiella thermophila TaxID=911321 RepID=UPI0037437B0B
MHIITDKLILICLAILSLQIAIQVLVEKSEEGPMSGHGHLDTHQANIIDDSRDYLIEAVGYLRSIQEDLEALKRADQFEPGFSFEVFVVMSYTATVYMEVLSNFTKIDLSQNITTLRGIFYFYKVCVVMLVSVDIFTPGRGSSSINLLILPFAYGKV